MGLRSLFGMDDDGDRQEATEIDSQIVTFTCAPGQPVEAEVVVRGGSRGLAVEGLSLGVVVKCHGYDGSPDRSEVMSLDNRRYVERVAPGTEERLPFYGRLPWETPVTELGGQALGVDVSLHTKLSWESEAPVEDLDFLHVAAPPLYEAVFAAFGAEGYRVEGSQVIDSYIPDVESHSGLHQIFFLTDRSRGAQRFAELEVVLQQNQVGAMVYVRRAARSAFDWEDKPSARSFPAAHHEAGGTDLGPRVREALEKLALVDG